MFSWLQRKVHDSIIAGVNSALAELAGVHQPAAELPAPVRLMLPAPPEDERPAPAARKAGKAS